MLYRKITKRIEEYLSADSDRMLLIDGARQIGKSYLIRWVGQRMFTNYIEINMEEDKLGDSVSFPMLSKSSWIRFFFRKIETSTKKTARRLERVCGLRCQIRLIKQSNKVYNLG